MIDAKRLRALGNDLTRIAGELASFRGAFEISEPSALPPIDFRALIRSRRLRERIFPDGLFADPAWDMLLELAARHAEGRGIAINGLCEVCAVAPTTAHRWVSVLEAQGMLTREADPDDRRRINLRLTEPGLRAISDYFAAAQEADLPIA